MTDASCGRLHPHRAMKLQTAFPDWPAACSVALAPPLLGGHMGLLLKRDEWMMSSSWRGKSTTGDNDNSYQVAPLPSSNPFTKNAFITQQPWTKQQSVYQTRWRPRLATNNHALHHQHFNNPLTTLPIAPTCHRHPPPPPSSFSAAQAPSAATSSAPVRQALALMPLPAVLRAT